MSSRMTSNATSFGCLALFLLPFLLSGLFVLFKGVTTLAEGSGFTEEVMVMLVVGSMFTGVSIGFFALLRYNRKLQKEEALQRAERADSPWLWKKNWVDGRVTSSSAAGLIFIWIFALAFSGFTIPLVYKFITDESPGERLMILIFGGLFGLAASGLLFAAIHATIRWLKYGRSYCELVTNPGVIGGHFRAEVHTKLRLGPMDQVALRLSCIRRYVTGSGKNRSTRNDVKWQEEMKVDSSDVARTRSGASAIPVNFAIPRDCLATTLDDSNDRILWSLKVEAEVPGVDFAADYEVPVFVTDESSDTPSPEHAEAYALDHEEIMDYAANSKIKVRPASGGGTEIHVPPARAVGPAIGVTVFAGIWSGAMVMIITQGAPFLFFIVFGFFEVLIVWGALSLWFGSTTTVLNGDTVEITHKLLGRGRTRIIPKSEIESVKLHIGMQSGNTSYYSVQLCLPGKRTRSVANSIRDKNEARWIAGVVETYLEAN